MTESTEQPARAGSTRDANGRVVKLLDPYPLWVRGSEEPIERPVLDRLARDLGIAEDGRRTLRRRLVFAGLALAAIVVGLGAMVAIEGRPAWDDLKIALNPAILAAVFLPIMVTVYTARVQRMQKLRRVMLRHRRCPHCGYNLAALPVEAGSCTCPECACAWPGAELGAALEPGDDSPALAPAGRERLLLVMTGLGVLAFLGALVIYLLRVR